MRSKRIRRRPFSVRRRFVASDRNRRADRGDQFLSLGVPLQGRRGASARLFARAARVVAETMNGHTPNVWISDRYSAQQKPSAPHIKPFGASGARQRPMRWSMDRTAICPCGSSCGLGKAFDLARRLSPVSPLGPIASKKRELEKATRPPFLPQRQNATSHASCRPKIGRAQDQLLIFCDYPGEVRGHPTTARSESCGLRDPAKSYQRLPRHVGRPSRG